MFNRVSATQLIVAASSLVGCLCGLAFGKDPGAEREADALQAAIPSAEAIVDDETVRQVGYVYKFSISLTKGQRYQLSFRELAGKDTPVKDLGRWPLESESDAPVALTLRFNDLKPDPAAAGLLGQAKELGIRRECEGGYPRGVFTIVRVPMSAIPRAEKKQIVPATSKDRAAIGPDGRRLLLIVRNEVDPNADVANVYPRAELVIAKAVSKPKPREKPEPEPIDPLELLLEHWDGQRSLIGTALIKFRMIRTGGDLAPLTRDEFNALVKETGLATPQPDLRGFARRISTAETLADPPWRSIELLVCGNKVRASSLIGGARTIHLFDGEFAFELSRVGNPRPQLNVGMRAGLLSLSDVRFLPPWDREPRSSKTRTRS